MQRSLVMAIIGFCSIIQKSSDLIMRFILIFILLLTCQKVLDAQITLERQVMSCFALETISPNATINSTAGETVVSTISNSAGFVTQGFHQPIADPGVQIQYVVYRNQCDDTYEVEITSISHCFDLDSIKIVWNNNPGDYYQKLLPAVSHLEITSPGGCYFNAVFDFLLLDAIVLPCDLIFYNYISPNGDGSNDRWYIEKIGYDLYAENHVSIVNRWGVLVWEASNYNNTDIYWDGRSQSGENLPDGTYYYKVEVAGIIKSGFVEIIR